MRTSLATFTNSARSSRSSSGVTARLTTGSYRRASRCGRPLLALVHPGQRVVEPSHLLRRVEQPLRVLVVGLSPRPTPPPPTQARQHAPHPHVDVVPVPTLRLRHGVLEVAVVDRHDLVLHELGPLL